MPRSDPLLTQVWLPEPWPVSYPEFLARQAADPLPWSVPDELAPIAISYTSGTTGRPKGVIYTHRGAYLNSFAQIIHSRYDENSVYLWTLPMFHCNGWCTPWALTAIGGMHVCLRDVRGDAIWQQLREHGVTHLNAAPTVVSTILNSPPGRTADPAGSHHYGRGAAQPDDDRAGSGADGLRGHARLRADRDIRPVHRVPATAALGHPVRRPARRIAGPPGRSHDPPTGGLRVVDQEMADVPADGETIGEIVMRGNTVMAGYYLDPEATDEAFRGGWFHSGDLGVMYPDGYIELRDRAKDIIISGGENISSVEVEQALMSHPDVLEAAVVGVPDDKWGERPKAFVVLRPGTSRDPAGADRARADQDRRLQGAPRGRRHRGPAQDLHGKDPEIHAARKGMGRPRPARERLTGPAPLRTVTPGGFQG